MRINIALTGLAFAAVAACSDTPTAPVEVLPTAEAKPGHALAAKKGGATIVELAQATPALSTLVTAIGVSDASCGTDFAGALSTTEDQYTVFAPTNAAFEAIIGALGAETVLSCDVLPTVLAYHVTRGRHHSRSVLAHRGFRMLSGEYAPVQGATIAGAPLNLGLLDISAANGIVHVIDAVMVPPSLN